MTKFQASLIVLLAGVSYGLLSGFTKHAYSLGITTGHLITMQNIVGASILWLLVLLKKDKLFSLTGKKVIQLLSVGILPGLTGVFYYLALRDLPAAIGIVLLFQFTWMGVLLDYLFEGRKIGRKQIYALLCLLPGTALAVGLNPASLELISLNGLILGVLAAVTYAGFLYSTGKIAVDVPPFPRSALIITGSLLINLIIFPPVGLGQGVITGDLFLWGSLMGIFGPVIPTVCLTYGVPHIGAGLSAILGAVELPMVVAVAYFFLGEKVNMLQWAGIIVILLGVYIANREHVSLKQTE